MAFDPKQYAGAAAGAATGFFFGGPLGALVGAILGNIGQAQVEKALTPHWVRQLDCTASPGDYVAFAFQAPADWDDAKIALYKQSLAALGFNAAQQHPSGITAPPPPGPRGVGFQGRYQGAQPRNICADLPPNTPVAVLIVHPRGGR